MPAICVRMYAFLCCAYADGYADAPFRARHRALLVCAAIWECSQVHSMSSRFVLEQLQFHSYDLSGPLTEVHQGRSCSSYWFILTQGKIAVSLQNNAPIPRTAYISALYIDLLFCPSPGTPQGRLSPRRGASSRGNIEWRYTFIRR